jgi:SAM-dependent methyltransferase
VLPPYLHYHWVSRKIAEAIGYPYYHPHWARTVLYERASAFIRALDPSRLDVLEISPGDNEYWRQLPFRSHSRLAYPEFDVCRDRLEPSYDLVIADQVFEHTLQPWRGVANVRHMLRPGGWFFIATPFLLRVHAHPIDCSRWTELGLRQLLLECGADWERIETASWGNRRAIRGNFRRWTRQTWWRSLRNEPKFPVMVWAFAQAPRIT